MKNSKKIIIQGIICVGLLCVIWGGYYLANSVIENMNHRQIELYEDDFSWVYQVDSVESEDKEIVFHGFAFEVGRDVIEGSFEIVLHDMESGENYFPKMNYVERVDVNEYFICENDYLKSGFEASIKAKKLNLKEKNYEILLRVLNSKTAYRTGTYIADGVLMYTNPMTFEPLDVEGTELEKIVEQGVLRVYRPDYGMYVYQYEGELYWIAEKEYGFVDGDTFIEYQLDTTQISKLPEYRLENQWYWDNMGFLFSKNELTDCDTGKYRVAKCALPMEYSIVRMWTGNYIKDWIWQQYFRPYYVFN